MVIPSSFASTNNETVPAGLHFAPVFQWDGSHEGNVLWSGSEVRFEDLCVIPDAGAGIKAGQRFQRDAGALLFIPGLVNDTHPARADAADHVEAVVGASQKISEKRFSAGAQMPQCTSLDP